MNQSHKLMTPLGFHLQIHAVMRDTGASWLLNPSPPPSPHSLAPELAAHKHGSRAGQQKLNRRNRMRFNVALCLAVTVQSESVFGTSV